MTEAEATIFVPDFLLHSTQYSVIITNIAGEIEYMNSTCEEKHGVKSADHLGKSSALLFSGEELNKCLEAIEKSFLKPGKPVKVSLTKFNAKVGLNTITSWDITAVYSSDQLLEHIVCIGSDKTEYVRAAKKNKSASEQLEQILSHIGDGFFVVDSNWKVVLLNHISQKLIGERSQNLVGRNLFDVLPANINPVIVEELKLSMQHKSTRRFEVAPFIYSGKFFRFIIYPTNNGLAVLIRDVTEEHTQRQENSATKDKLQAILDSSSSTNLLLSPELTVLSYNKRAKENVRQFFNEELEINDDFKKYVQPDSANVFYENFAKALQGEAINKEYPTQTAVGKIWYEFKYVPVYNNTGTIIGVSFDALNIHERKVAEEQLKQSQHLLSAIYNSTTDGCAFIGKDLKVIYENKVAKDITEEVLGISETVGKDSLTLVMPEFRKEFENLYIRALKGERAEVEKFDGKKWWLVAIHPVRVDGTDDIVGIALNVKNITDQKEARLALAKQNEVLKDIAWKQSHEVRGPVASILGLCALLAANEQPTAAEQQQYIGLLTKAAEALDNIIKEVVNKTYNELSNETASLH
jgi:PAS domain S-box-containing protein